MLSAFSWSGSVLAWMPGAWGLFWVLFLAIVRALLHAEALSLTQVLLLSTHGTANPLLATSKPNRTRSGYWSEFSESEDPTLANPEGPRNFLGLSRGANRWLVHSEISLVEFNTGVHPDLIPSGCMWRAMCIERDHEKVKGV